ncbi:MAG: DUF86 domain-containing protein [Sulfuricellaceae bacterium]
MSDAIQTNVPQRDWRLYLADMIAFSERVLAYTEGFDQPRFEQSGLNYDATVRNLELIGEAATHIPQIVRNFAPHIQWRQIVAMRNRLIHGYLGIDNDTLWSVIQGDIPPLPANLEALQKAADENQIQ